MAAKRSSTQRDPSTPRGEEPEGRTTPRSSGDIIAWRPETPRGVAAAGTPSGAPPRTPGARTRGAASPMPRELPASGWSPYATEPNNDKKVGGRPAVPALRGSILNPAGTTREVFKDNTPPVPPGTFAAGLPTASFHSPAPRKALSAVDGNVPRSSVLAPREKPPGLPAVTPARMSVPTTPREAAQMSAQRMRSGSPGGLW